MLLLKGPADGRTFPVLVTSSAAHRRCTSSDIWPILSNFFLVSSFSRVYSSHFNFIHWLLQKSFAPVTKSLNTNSKIQFEFIWICYVEVNFTEIWICFNLLIWFIFKLNFLRLDWNCLIANLEKKPKFNIVDYFNRVLIILKILNYILN